jgi:hypothetical protein
MEDVIQSLKDTQIESARVVSKKSETINELNQQLKRLTAECERAKAEVESMAADMLSNSTRIKIEQELKEERNMLKQEVGLNEFYIYKSCKGHSSSAEIE